MKKLLIATTAFLMASQANAVIYGITYTYERDAASSIADAYYLYSRELVTPLPDPTHAVNFPPYDVFHPGGAEPIYGTGTIDTVSGDIVLNGIDIELVIPSGSVGYFGFTQTLHGSFSGNTYTQTSNSLNWTDYVCEAAEVLVNTCISFSWDTGKVDPDGIVFSSLGIGGTGSFFQKEAFFPNSETRMNFEIVTPIPAAAWLFGSALLGLAGFGRHRR